MSGVRGQTGERGRARGAAAASVAAAAALIEAFEAPHFRYHFRCYAPQDRRAVVELKREVGLEIAKALDPGFDARRLILLERELAAQPRELAWEADFKNLVVTVGKNDILTNEFTGSAYTAAWYMGLVDGATTPTFAAGDTMASHAGWSENTSISNSARPTLAFAAASAGSIALSSAAVFDINAASQTIAGGFFCTNATLGGTTGTLYSAGAFTGGNKAVSTGDTLSVSATQSV